MARFIRNLTKSNGLYPGSFVFIGKQKVETARITVIDYDKDNLTEKEISSVEDILELLDKNSVTWVNIDGIHDTELLKSFSKSFDIHPLLIEDLLNTGQRPKIEDFDNAVFFTMKMLDYDDEEKIITTEQISIVLKDKFLITFQEQPGDIFDPVRERIRKKKGRIRNLSTDYLAYALLDTVIDNYLHIIEVVGDEIEEMENDIIKNHSSSIINRLNTYKREINFLSKTVRPVKEGIIRLVKMDNNIVSSEIDLFLRDLQDLASNAVEAIDVYREMLTDYYNLYNSFLNNKTNDIFRFLTIFSTIFIPLTFIAGIYGTNFEYLPELHYRYSYFIFLGAMGLIAAFMIFIFKKKKWM